MTIDVSLLLLLAALLGFTTAGMLHKKRRLRLLNLQGQQHSMAATCELKKLLTQIQQHRGMVNAYLNGDDSFKYKISVLQTTIERQFETIARLLAGDDPAHLEGYRGIQEQWRNLHKQALSLDKDDSFERHCQLIASVLNLIRDIAEYSQLHQESVCPFSFIDILWHLLPDTAEAIGQARAIGTGMAAAGTSPVTERIKLGFLVTRIRQTIHRVQQGLANIQSTAIGNSNHLRQSYSDVQSRITGLINDIESQLLASERPTVNPSVFFDNATNTLSGVFALYDQGETLANSALQLRLDGALRDCRYSLAGMLLALVLLSVSIAACWL